MNDETRDNSIDEQDDDAPERNASEDLTPEGQDAEERDPEQIQVLPLVALRDTVIFPEMIVPLQVGRERSVKALDRAVRASQPVALITQHMRVDPEIEHTGGTRGWPGDSPLIVLDCKKLRRLGWQPQLNIEQAIERTLDWLDANTQVFEEEPV